MLHFDSHWLVLDLPNIGTALEDSLAVCVGANHTCRVQSGSSPSTNYISRQSQLVHGSHSAVQSALQR
jgi:hypothetical protein